MKIKIEVSILSVLCIFAGVTNSRPYHTITIDGDLSDWTTEEDVSKNYNEKVNYKSELKDSLWDPGQDKNELKRVFVSWDKENIYIGIEYIINNYGLLVFIDTNPYASSGVDNLLHVNAWNRKLIFGTTYQPEFFYGAWDSSWGNFYQIKSSTYVCDISAEVTLHSRAKYGQTSTVPGSELKIPFNTLYRLGSGKVPVSATIAVFATLCTGDLSSELYQGTTIQFGYIGGDTIPEQEFDLSALSISTITKFIEVFVDIDPADGIPDDKIQVQAFYISDEKLSNKVFSPYGKVSSTELSVKFSQPVNITIKIFDLNGNLILEPVTGKYHESVTEPYKYSWDGKNSMNEFVSTGVYILNLIAETPAGKSIRKNFSVAVIK